MMHLLLTVIGFLLAELKSLDLLYRFQIKEYRLDRFAAMIKDKDPEVLVTIGKMPARSMRNLLAAAISTGILLVWSVFAFTHDWLLFATIFLYFAIAFLATACGILITWLPSRIRKQFLAFAALARMKRFPVTVIGITGSFGKTTTKEYLFDILSQKYTVAKTLQNMNTTAGVAMSVLTEVGPETQILIAEMGAYKPGEIAEICRMIKPRYGILTAIGNQHLELFGSRERLISAKKELLLALPATGKAFVNAARTQADQLRPGVKAMVVPYYPQDKSINLNAYHLPPEIVRENLIPCILLARELGLAEHMISAGIQTIKGKRQRLTPRTGKNGTVVIDNSYNTNREGFIFSLNLLNNRKEKTKIMVTPGIIELGGEKRQTYDHIIHVLAKTNVSLFTTDADFRKPSIKNVRIFKNEQSLQEAILTEVGSQTVILFEGRMNRGFISSLLQK